VYLLPLRHLPQGLIDLLQLIPANRPGLAVARWRVSSHSDDLDLEIFQEALVEPGLLEAIFLSVVLLRSGRALGDTTETMGISDKVFAGPPLLT
jgi:hypothetical protein